MQSRGVGFTTCLLLVAAATTIPIVLMAGAFALNTYNNGGRVNGGMAGLDRTYVSTELHSLIMVQDRFQRAYTWDPQQRNFISIDSIDPESNRSEMVRQRLPVIGSTTTLPNGWCHVTGDAEHLWVVSNDRVFERRDQGFVELAMMPPDTVSPPGAWRNWDDCRAFVSGGRLYCVTTMPNMERELFQLVDDKWVSLGEIHLYDETLYWMNDDFRQLLGDGTASAGQPSQSKGSSVGRGNSSRRKFSVEGKFQILTIGSEMHMFWRLPDRILYRRGIELVPSSYLYGPTGATSSAQNQTASALDVANAESFAHGWSLVSDGLDGDTEWYRLKVGGEPAVVFIDRSNPNTPRAKALRIEAGNWIEFAATELPLLADVVTAGSRDDGSVSYLATATHLGRAKVLALEPTGFRLTPYEYSNWLHGVAGYVFFASYLAFCLLMAAVLAIVAWLLMWRDTGLYAFGLQEVRLASILERGAARILDLLLIGLATAGCAFILNRIFQPDWLTFLEGMQKFDDRGNRQPMFDLPPVMIAFRIVVTCLFVLIATWMLLVLMQARYGLTPGKWICGLRTVRTSLRPCGFTHSLFRELMMCIDCLDLVCWTPGILSIAFSSNRQRLGDRLADTVVVRRSR